MKSHSSSHFFSALLFLLGFTVYISPTANASSISGLSDLSIAQDRKFTVTGTVIDDLGYPLPGVTIQVKGDPSHGVTTDFEGQFTLDVSENDKVLVFSYVGMETLEMEIKPGKTSDLKVAMKEDTALLDEVVVTGYQTISKERATGSYTVLNPKELSEKLQPSVLAQMEGKVAGLLGETLRGVTTLAGNTRPLYVVDGMPFEGNVASINPSTVANVTVLKDAAATSIYGARAANGVIVITTKRGEEASNVRVSYSGHINLYNAPDMEALNLMNSSELVDYADYVVNKSPLQQIPDDYKYAVNPLVLDIMRKRNGEITQEELDKRYAEYRSRDNRDQLRDFYLRTGIDHQHNITLSGGTSKNSYVVTGNYLGSEPYDKSTNSRKYGFTLRNYIGLTDFMTADLSVMASYDDSFTDMGYGDYTSMYLSYPSYQLFFDPNGNPLPLQNPSGYSEYYINYLMEQGLYDLHYYPQTNVGLETTNAHSSFYRANAGLSFKIIPGLTLDLKYVGEFTSSKEETLNEADSFGAKSEIVAAATMDDYTGEILFNVPEGGIFYQTRTFQTHHTGRAQLNYLLERGDHYFIALAGSEIRAVKNTNTRVHYLGYDPETLNYVPVDPTLLFDLNNTFDVSNYYSHDVQAYNRIGEFEDRYVSFYANASYSFAERYDLTGSIRIDQSNLFGTDPKVQYRPLWSLGGSWHIAKEPFMSNRPSWLNNLSLRVTHGIGGNIPKLAGPFLTLSAPYYDPIVDAFTSQIDNVPNPTLRWEKTQTTNVGLDFALFDHKLRGTLEGYNKYTTDLLAERQADPTLGNAVLLLNYGSMRNVGFEATLNGAFSFGEFLWEPSFVFGLNRNKLLNVEEDNPNTFSFTRGSTITVGYPMNSVFSYPSAGLDPEKGTPRYYYTDPETGERHITDNPQDVQMEDLIFSGTREPLYHGSFSNRFSYKGLSLSFMLTYSGGGVMRAPVAQYTGAGASGVNVPREYAHIWKRPGDEKDPTMGPAITGVTVQDEMTTHAWGASDIHILPTDYIKLRDITLSYELPSQWVSRIGLRSMNFTAQVQNIAVLPFNNRGLNPEEINMGLGYGSGQHTISGNPISFSLGTNINF